jgi:hypothetical protein
VKNKLDKEIKTMMDNADVSVKNKKKYYRDDDIDIGELLNGGIAKLTK